MSMIDVNRNGVIEPEEEALGDALAEDTVTKSGSPKQAAAPWLVIIAGIIIVVLIILLLMLAL